MDKKVEHSMEVIRKAIEKYDKIAIACSFGKDSMVIVHLAQQIMKSIPIFAVMTPFKPRKTFDYKDKMVRLWKLNIKEYFQKDDIDAGAHKLWETEPDKCCSYFKVGPTKEAVSGLDAWITGLRNTEGQTRENYKEVEKRGSLVKINPILNWTEADVWRYLAVNAVPVHPWYGIGYRSLGCAPCTTPGGVLERDGRWKGTSKCGGECGIHTSVLRE